MTLIYGLSQSKILWTTFGLMIALTAAFGIIMHVGQFGILDEMYVADDIRAHIGAMSQRQKSLHVWMTGTIDVAYPLAYGGFFIGIAMRYFGRFGIWLALPSLLVIPVDLTEGFAQIMLLTGHESFMGLKVLVTPIKLVLYILGLCITAAGLVLALKELLNKRSA